MPYKDPEVRKKWQRAYNPGHYAANKALYRKYSVTWRLKNPAKVLLTSAKMRARKNDIEFNIDLSDVVIPEFCPVLGIPIFCSTTPKVIKRNMPNSPSLDRIDPKRGYVKGNVQVISWRANDLKSDGTADELEKIAAYIRRRGDQ